jgi:hypothetical protein
VKSRLIVSDHIAAGGDLVGFLSAAAELRFVPLR